LQDQAVKIADAFYLVGRKDFSGEGYGDRRADLSTILEAVDRRAPIILMDHQPRASTRDEASAGGVDLLLSGHTHAGQLWPLDFISGLLFGETWGYGRQGAMHFYVSSGVGTWGPEVRLGNRPEIVEIRLRFL
jgi:predicted MPP superfamily phosphohydrolase